MSSKGLPDGQRDRPDVMSRVRLGAGIGGLILLVLFLVQNFHDANVQFLWFDVQMPMVFALLVAAACGALVTLLFGFVRGRSRRAEMRERARR